MAIYRFRVSFEDYDEVYREIDMRSKHTFLDLHAAIHQSTGYSSEAPSSFYVSNDHWKKGDEIAYLPDGKKLEKGVSLMENCKLSTFVNDPHQKFYYIYNFPVPFDFHVQLIKILKEEEGKEYPFLFKSVGIPPKLVVMPTIGADEDDDGDATDDTTENAFSFEAELEYDETEGQEEEAGENDDDENGEKDDSNAGMDFEEEF